MTHLWWKSKAAAALLFVPTTQWHSWHLPSLQVSCSTVKPIRNFQTSSILSWQIIGSSSPTGWVDGLQPLVQSSPLHNLMKKVMLSPCCLNWQSQDCIHTGMNIMALIGLLMISQAVRFPGWNDYTVFFCLHNCDKLVMQISYVISNMYIQLFSLLLSRAESKVFHCRGTSRQRPVNFFLVTININHACRPCSFVSGEAHPQFPGLLFPLRLSLREKKLDRILLRFDLCYSYSLLAQNSS